MGLNRKPSNHTETAGGGAVSTFSNADGSLTIAPNLGDVVASLNVGNANTWTADQTFNDNVKVTLGTGGDADIFYDGTDVRVDARVVGSGNLITKNTVPSADSTYDLGSASIRWLAVYSDENRSSQYDVTASDIAGVDGDLNAGNDRAVWVNGIVTLIDKMA